MSEYQPLSDWELERAREWSVLSIGRDPYCRLIATIDALKAEAANCKTSHDLDAETIAGLVEDVERLTADNAALIKALKQSGEFCHADECEGSHDWDTEDSNDCTCGATRINLAVRAALSQHHPGAALPEELAALRNVETFMRHAMEVKVIAASPESPLMQALTTLDAIRNREGR